MQVEDLRELRRDLETMVVVKILATCQNNNMSNARPPGQWELDILCHLIACCTPGAQEQVNEDGAGEGSEYEDSGVEHDEYEVMVNSSKRHQIRKTN